MKLTGILSRARRASLWLAALTTCVLLSGCAGPRIHVITAADVEIPLQQGAKFTPGVDGVFLGLERYRTYRRLVANEIMRLDEQKRAESSIWKK